jgi:CHAD domain-containing protein
VPAAEPQARNHAVASVAGQLLAIQYRLIRKHEAGALAACGTEPLHQLRVGIRRFRAVLRFFRKPLAKTSAASLDRALGRLNRDLGRARDVDVWVDFLLSEDVRRKMADSQQWKSFLRHQVELKRRQQANARRILRGERYARLRQRMDRFLEVELPRAGNGARPGELRRFMAQRIRKAFQRSLKAVGRRLRLSPKRMHEARVRIRRARYWAEFFEPMLGPVSRKLARRLKRTADELGWVRDLDVQLRRFCRAQANAPRRLVDQLQKTRRSHLAASKRAVRRLRKPRFKRRVLKALSPRAAR